MQTVINIKTESKEKLYDITSFVADFLEKNQVANGAVNVYVRGATAAIMIQENWDDSLQDDVITLLQEFRTNVL